MTYQQALDYIHAVNWVFCKPGLERIGVLCRALGDPQNDLKFIHVAGTNGKGSFCAMTAKILESAGYRVGLYTSPYIVRFNERMQVNGVPISDEELIELVGTVLPVADAMEDKPTEFELITALAFLYFKRHGCDIVLLECGLGGRLDATNIMETPILSVITGIALDHTAILGDTIEQIAAEKAGICRPGVPVLFGGTHPGAEAVIRGRAETLGAPFALVDRSTLVIRQTTVTGTTFDYGPYTALPLSLLGTYQPYNAATVLTALEALTALGFPVSEAHIRAGLSAVRWPARFELLQTDPILIADGGHNPEGIEAAVDSIRAYFGTKKVRIVTGVMADKDYRYMASRMAEVAAQVFCLTPDNPRALAAEDYAAVFEGLGVAATATESVGQAVALALKASKEDGLPIVSLGSLYMYGEVKAAAFIFRQAGTASTGQMICDRK